MLEYISADVSQYQGIEIQNNLDIIINNKNEIAKIPNLINLNTTQNTQMNNILFPNIDSAYEKLENKKNEIAKMLYPIGAIAITDINQPPNIIGTIWENINLNVIIDRADLFNSYFNVNNCTLEQDSNGKIWFTIFDHNSNSGKNIYSAGNTDLKCDTDGLWSQWWMLKYNDTLFKTDDGKFEFKLLYPDNSSTGVNHFTQKSNPVLSNDTVTGYTAISCTWTSGFTGLSYDGTYCLLSGCANTTNWWYAIAPYQAYQGGVPGPNPTVVTKRTQVKIRVPQLENNNVASTLIEHYYWRRVS